MRIIMTRTNAGYMYNYLLETQLSELSKTALNIASLKGVNISRANSVRLHLTGARLQHEILTGAKPIMSQRKY